MLGLLAKRPHFLLRHLNETSKRTALICFLVENVRKEKIDTSLTSKYEATGSRCMLDELGGSKRFQGLASVPVI